MQNTILIIVMVMIFTIVFAILFAAILQRGKFKGKNFFRVIFYIPNILSIVVIGGIFGAIYDPSNGLLNTFLEAVHLDFLTHKWMGEPKIVIYSIYLCACMAGNRILYGNVHVWDVRRFGRSL